MNYDLNRFGRVFIDGDYYIGEFRNNKRHGKGKHVYESGMIKDGIWENNEFI